MADIDESRPCSSADPEREGMNGITMSPRAAEPILDILRVHVDESGALREVRSRLVNDPHVTLHSLGRHDQRLAAHLDGLAVAGENAWPLCAEALESPSEGAVFASATRVLEEKHLDRLARLLEICRSARTARRGLISAFGWMESLALRDTVSRLLASEDPQAAEIGLAACSLHRVDPGHVLETRMRDAHPRVRERALRAAGELGRRDVLTAITGALADDDPGCQFWAARSGVMLGDRNLSLRALTGHAMRPGPFRSRAFRLAIQAMPVSLAHTTLQDLAKGGGAEAWVIEGSGVAGNAGYVPWLIAQMNAQETARRAGEAFSLITGMDLAQAGLDRQQPDNLAAGPNEDASDPEVDLNPDDGLPWPDQERVQRWWDANKSRFTPGQRYFMGAPVTREQCIEVLKTGYQRQRILAAHYLCLLEPGTPLFNTSAPAWRQQRLLADMK
jgi:uncharacterized protein (TIGR02270 family)